MLDRGIQAMYVVLCAFVHAWLSVVACAMWGDRRVLICEADML
jgi:hypothetical protein